MLRPYGLTLLNGGFWLGRAWRPQTDVVWLPQAQGVCYHILRYVQCRHPHC